MSSYKSEDKLTNNVNLDYVRSISNFDLSDPENQYNAFNWQNCSLLLKSKNLNKGA